MRSSLNCPGLAVFSCFISYPARTRLMWLCSTMALEVGGALHTVSQGGRTTVRDGKRLTWRERPARGRGRGDLALLQALAANGHPVSLQVRGAGTNVAALEQHDYSIFVHA